MIAEMQEKTGWDVRQKEGFRIYGRMNELNLRKTEASNDGGSADGSVLAKGFIRWVPAMHGRASVDCRMKRAVYHTVKRCFDLIFSLVALCILSPLLAVVSIMVRLEDGGPVLHRRICVGKGNKTYIMYKFRTMLVDADNRLDLFSEEQLLQYMQGVKIEDDPRITKIGRFLRSTSIDELPQLFSVLKSDMSLVGPRPVIEREAAAYGTQREKLLSCKPGITGLWQVRGRGTIPYLSDEAMELQLEYVERQSILTDLQILMETVKIVLSRKGAR